MDTIADMLTRIRNAQAVKKETAEIPFSKMKFEIAKILEANGFIAKVEKKGRKDNKLMEITLNYKDGQEMELLRRISKPSRRVYIGVKDLYLSRAGKVKILSTPKGILTDKDAKKQNVGGELLCEVW